MFHFQLVPFAHVEKLRRCPSCNSLYDKSVSDFSGTDGEENWAAFEERYEVFLKCLHFLFFIQFAM